MPHIKVKEFPNIPFPQGGKKYIFHGIGESLYGARKVIDVEYEDVHFLLEIKKKSNNEVIIKPDKITRPASNAIIKSALATLVEIGNLHVIQSNIVIRKKDYATQAFSYLKPINFFIDNFPLENEIWIEIGFGSGRHLLYQAKKHPEILFIGIEIHKPSIEQLLKQIALQKIDNIYVVDYDARLFLEFVPSNVVGKIFVHFPVPWDKKPHRRVISKEFVQEAKRVLKKGGKLELRTDSVNYFQYACEILLQEKKVKIEIQKNFDNAISSKYEDRWKRLGKDIFDIIFISLENSKEVRRECEFDFQSCTFVPEIVKSISTRPFVFDDFFVHFEDVYKFNEQKFLFMVSMGNFHRPEHKYIWYTKDGIFYYNAQPVCSKANQKAHNFIKEIFNGKKCYSG